MSAIFGIPEDELDAWIKDLRSGVVKQARGYLRIVEDDGEEDTVPNYLDEFCCLGVLDRSKGYRYPEHGLSKEELESSVPLVPCGLTTECTSALAHANDSWKFTFIQIADMLDANRESLIATGDFPGDWWADHLVYDIGAAGGHPEFCLPQGQIVSSAT